MWGKSIEAVSSERYDRLPPVPVQPHVRLWDGDWNFLSSLVCNADWEWELNDASVVTVTVTEDSPYYDTLKNPQAWPKSTLYLTADIGEARWSGRVTQMSHQQVGQGRKGIVLSVTSDYVKLKELLAWANPFLPDQIQFPKAHILFGPAKWVVSSIIFSNLLRRGNSLWKLPDRIINVSQWVDLDMSGWPVVLRPPSMVGDKSPMAITSARFETVDEVIQPIMEDAGLCVEWRRYLPGDPPINDLKGVRRGALILEVVDKSGWTAEGTSLIGSVVSGLVRAATKVAANGFDQSTETITKPTVPDEYRRARYWGTVPSMPWVVLDENSGCKKLGLEWTPPGPSQFVGGGTSMLGVNETIKAGIIGLGGFIGAMFGQSQAGAAAEAILEPLYKDTIAAFQSKKDHLRIREQGWDYPFEAPLITGRANSLNMLSKLRMKRAETAGKLTAEVELPPEGPYVPGPPGHGDFWIGDRVAIDVGVGKLIVQYVTSIKWKQDKGWRVKLGPLKRRTGDAYLADRLDRISQAAHTLGVW